MTGFGCLLFNLFWIFLKSLPESYLLDDYCQPHRRTKMRLASLANGLVLSVSQQAAANRDIPQEGKVTV